MITDSEEQLQLQWYIQMSDGTRKGPFTSSEAANATMIAESTGGQVVQLTEDGNQLLLG